MTNIVTAATAPANILSRAETVAIITKAFEKASDRDVFIFEALRAGWDDKAIMTRWIVGFSKGTIRNAWNNFYRDAFKRTTGVDTPYAGFRGLMANPEDGAQWLWRNHRPEYSSRKRADTAERRLAGYSHDSYESSNEESSDSPPSPPRRPSQQPIISVIAPQEPDDPIIVANLPWLVADEPIPTGSSQREADDPPAVAINEPAPTAPLTPATHSDDRAGEHAAARVGRNRPGAPSAPPPASTESVVRPTLADTRRLASANESLATAAKNYIDSLDDEHSFVLDGIRQGLSASVIAASSPDGGRAFQLELESVNEKIENLHSSILEILGSARMRTFGTLSPSTKDLHRVIRSGTIPAHDSSGPMPALRPWHDHPVKVHAVRPVRQPPPPPEKSDSRTTGNSMAPPPRMPNPRGRGTPRKDPAKEWIDPNAEKVLKIVGALTRAQEFVLACARASVSIDKAVLTATDFFAPTLEKVSIIKSAQFILKQIAKETGITIGDTFGYLQLRTYIERPGTRVTALAPLGTCALKFWTVDGSSVLPKDHQSTASQLADERRPEPAPADAQQPPKPDNEHEKTDQELGRKASELIRDMTPLLNGETLFVLDGIRKGASIKNISLASRDAKYGYDLTEAGVTKRFKYIRRSFVEILESQLARIAGADANLDYKGFQTLIRTSRNPAVVPWREDQLPRGAFLPLRDRVGPRTPQSPVSTRLAELFDPQSPRTPDDHFDAGVSRKLEDALRALTADEQFVLAAARCEFATSKVADASADIHRPLELPDISRLAKKILEHVKIATKVFVPGGYAQLCTFLEERSSSATRAQVIEALRSHRLTEWEIRGKTIVKRKS